MITSINAFNDTFRTRYTVWPSRPETRRRLPDSGKDVGASPFITEP